MAEIIIYTRMKYPIRSRARAHLDSKGAAHRAIPVSGIGALRRAVMERSGSRRRAPRVFIDGRGIGSGDLQALDREGRLDPLPGRSGGN